MNTNILPILYTKDLILRPFQISDLTDFYEYAKNPNVGPMAGWEPHPNKDYSAKILRSIIQQGDVYAIVLQDSNKVIGSIGIHMRELPEPIAALKLGKNYREIGYVLSYDYWKHGYMTQALSAVITHCFLDRKLEALVASHKMSNSSSRRVLERCGFQYVGPFEKEDFFFENKMILCSAHILRYDIHWQPKSGSEDDGIHIF